MQRPPRKSKLVNFHKIKDEKLLEALDRDKPNFNSLVHQLLREHYNLQKK